MRLRQSGRVRQDEVSSWQAFHAQQSIDTARYAFDWRARAGFAGLVSVRDMLDAGVGRFHVRALGIVPLVRARSSAELTRGQVMRYLAELAWAPDAILHNADLLWRVEECDCFVVGTGPGDTAAEVTLNLDSDGRIAGAFAPDRGRIVGDTVVATPWRGRFSDYRRHDGRWLPFAGEVGWTLPQGDVVYWQGRIDAWEMGQSSSATRRQGHLPMVTANTGGRRKGSLHAK